MEYNFHHLYLLLNCNFPHLDLYSHYLLLIRSGVSRIVCSLRGSRIFWVAGNSSVVCCLACDLLAGDLCCWRIFRPRWKSRNPVRLSRVVPQRLTVGSPFGHLLGSQHDIGTFDSSPEPFVTAPEVSRPLVGTIPSAVAPRDRTVTTPRTRAVVDAPSPLAAEISTERFPAHMVSVRQW